MYKKLNLFILNWFFNLFTKKSVFQPGFNRPIQYKGEMGLVRDLYLDVFIYLSVTMVAANIFL